MAHVPARFGSAAGGRLASPAGNQAIVACELRVTGVVQGVGFRPFVHRLAVRYGLGGWVWNGSSGVRIRLEGSRDAIAGFTGALHLEAPPLARVEDVSWEAVTPSGAQSFAILPSVEQPDGRLPVSPDVATCPACRAELEDPADRRFQYPFITCTDCGPRFTVIESLPYDRERTSMRAFIQCETCQAEYAAPGDRRYHSETNSCPECGPRLWFQARSASTTAGASVGPRAGGSANSAIRDAARLLGEGRVLAVRGLGGFHLAVDATSAAAVALLRKRKLRDEKPLAVMVRTLEEAAELGEVGPEEAAVLGAPERPIVLLRRKAGSALAQEVAPGLGEVGVMLAYTPLHRLLLEAAGRPLVMTSGNRSDEPIATGNDEACDQLARLADGFLLHDREIVTRCDDSVVRMIGGVPAFLRRARGYAPLPLDLPIPSPRPLIAVGAQLKNTFTLAQEGTAFLSQHIGDLETVETAEHFSATLGRLAALFRIEPDIAVCDLHPDYLSTRLAQEMGLARVLTVQHHHAHIAAVLAEHGHTDPVIGLAFDGTGYGEDGEIWGAEALIADLVSSRRIGRLRYAPLPGGDRGAQSPWRSVLAYASLAPDAIEVSASAPWLRGVGEQEVRLARQQISHQLNAPLVSSMGRLFDAAAALLGIRIRSRYEGQAAMELEAQARTALATEWEAVWRVAPLPFPVREEGTLFVLDPVPLLSALDRRRAAGEDVGLLAALFQDAVARATAELAVRIRDRSGLQTVALGGGTFQNAWLVAALGTRLERAGFRVLRPRRLPANDGAISYGQAAVAAARLARED